MTSSTLLLPHQQRVVAEKAELDEKTQKLEAFVQGPNSAAVPKHERARLLGQLGVMKLYSSILGERIEAFGKA
jgi:hypothetical protein